MAAARRSADDHTRTNPERAAAAAAARASERSSAGDGGGGGGSSGGGGSLLSWVLGRPAAENAAAEAEEHPPPLDVSPTAGRRAPPTPTGPRSAEEATSEERHDDGEQQPAELWNETRGGRGQGSFPSEYARGASSDGGDDDDDDHASTAGAGGVATGGEREGGVACADGGWVAQARVQDLLGESRRLDADSLRALVGALIATVHSSLPLHERRYRRRCSGEGAGVVDGGSGGGAPAAETAGGSCEAADGSRGFQSQRRM